MCQEWSLYKKSWWVKWPLSSTRLGSLHQRIILGWSLLHPNFTESRMKGKTLSLWSPWPLWSIACLNLWSYPNSQTHHSHCQARRLLKEQGILMPGARYIDSWSLGLGIPIDWTPRANVIPINAQSVLTTVTWGKGKNATCAKTGAMINEGSDLHLWHSRHASSTDSIDWHKISSWKIFSSQAISAWWLLVSWNRFFTWFRLRNSWI